MSESPLEQVSEFSLSELVRRDPESYTKTDMLEAARVLREERERWSTNREARAEKKEKKASRSVEAILTEPLDDDLEF